jgi:alkanesulfonate monooxygenase SsuD/methylene tetrahydromethanopterin reductase-like flavin-dependent oxidoreductase (luciferase family)
MCEPKPVQTPHIPLWIGGAGEKMTLRVVAESADGWNTFMLPLDAYQQKLDALAEHCRDTGRDPADIRKSLSVQALVGETDAEVNERLPKAGGEAMRQRGVVGTPEQVAEQLLPYLKAGVRDFIFGARVPADMHSLELVATKVGPILKAEARSLAPA